jgi:hypothetical protein
MDDITISIPADFVSDFLTIVRTAGEQQLTFKQRALTADMVGQVADGMQQFLAELVDNNTATGAAVVDKPAKKKRRISAAGRKAIAEAQRKRWAEKQRKEK